MDRASGTATRERSAANTNTGNTPTSRAVRQRTDTGASVDVVQTGPRGNSRSLSGERVRNGDGTGSTFTGTATGRGGNSYGLDGERNRDGQGNRSASQRVTNSAGDTLYSRDRVRTRSESGVSRSVNTTRAPGVQRLRAARSRG